MLTQLSAPFWASLLLKMLATAALVVGVSALVERVGPFLGAMAATLPISAGPALLFVAIEHGPAFLQASAHTGLPAFAGTAVYAGVYARMAQRHRTSISVGSGVAAWLLTTLLITRRNWSVAGGIALNAIVYGTAILTTGSLRRAPPVMRVVRRIWDVPLRAGIVMSLVATVIILGRVLGPTAAGVAAPAPLVFLSIGLVLQPRVGGAVPAAMMANGLIGLLGIVAALAFLALSATALGSAAALSLALLICVAWNALLIGMRRMVRSQRMLR